MFCNLDRNTTCLQHEVPSEVPGQIRPENSMLDDLLTLWINSEEDDSTLLRNFNSEETCDLECLLNEECSFEQMQQLFNEFAQLVCPFHNHNLSELPTEPEVRAILKSIRPLLTSDLQKSL
ncbi:Oidioi.mRNA.OKI2018_I69.chr1.g3722.t1.cds [Oikopleura dioica]|uniref:Oidioi.mRNA.OKI2018_I69.chr1.g3722.t1.cds n=1 Tax=Oikopleura dioica TaxID=34765 RepID=A0ABN7SVL0_OIKDI|nr:Oidioi.mRNA.OKI2018_I69.chr1.g3722.t1.cds [Oikopleura dioica]